VRQYWPKGSDFRGITAGDLDFVMNRLNNRPRKTLGFKNPNLDLFLSTANCTSELNPRDPLTGLENRRAWHEAIAGYAENGRRLAICMIDLYEGVVFSMLDAGADVVARELAMSAVVVKCFKLLVRCNCFFRSRREFQTKRFGQARLAGLDSRTM
jgi:hypothetical protein